MMSRVFLLILTIVSSAASTLAQPGNDHWRFNAHNTCVYETIKTDVALVGHVTSVEVTSNSFITGHPLHWYRAVAKVEKVLKGEVQQEQEIYMQIGTAQEWSIRDKSFLFLANNIDRDLFKGLFAERFSFQINTNSEQWARSLKIIEGIFNGVAQPRVVGTVTERPWYGRWIQPGNPVFRPLSGITVIAEGPDGYRSTTQTDEAGRFQFENLPSGTNPQPYHIYYIAEPDLAQSPKGTYAFSLDLPKKMDIHSIYSLLENGKLPHVQLANSLCSATLNFDVEESGTITGKIMRNREFLRPTEPILFLYRIDPETKRVSFSDQRFVAKLSEPDPSGAISFSFEHIPVGPYILEIRTILHKKGELRTLFYPLAEQPEQAVIVTVTADKPTELDINLP